MPVLDKRELGNAMGADSKETRIAAGQTWNRAVTCQEPKLTQEIGKSLDPLGFLPVPSWGESRQASRGRLPCQGTGFNHTDQS